MQGNIKSPEHYDWSEFTRKERGFIKMWAIGHEFSYVTVHHLIHGLYRSGSGPRISNIIEAALGEALITEIPLDKAA